MAAQDTSEHSTESNLFSHFTNFRLKFSPPFKQETKPVQHREAEAIPLPVDDVNESNKASKKQEMVKFSDPKPIAPPPLKLEVQDSEQNPAARYLVYAFGGFLVMRWMWARWQERNRKQSSVKKDSSDNHESSPADDDDHGYHSV